MGTVAVARIDPCLQSLRRVASRGRIPPAVNDVAAMDDLRDPATLDSDEALVRLAVAGDEAAFARIVRLHRSAMVRACVVITLDTELAAEAVSAAWPLAWDRLASLEDPSRLRPWLCGIAAREARDVVLYGSSRLHLGPSGHPRPDPPPTTRGDDALVHALEGMRPDDRVFLALRDVAGLTPDELGRAVGATPRAVAAHTRWLMRGLGARLAAGSDRRSGPGGAVTGRLRSLADVSVGHVDVDAVARVAKITRHDRRNRVASLAVAGLFALVVLAVPYLGESGPWPALAAGMRSPLPWPSPSMDAAPREPSASQR